MKLRLQGMREEDGLVRVTLQKDERVLSILRATLEELKFSPRDYNTLNGAEIQEYSDKSEWFHRDGMDIIALFGSNKVWIIVKADNWSDFRNVFSQYVEWG